MWFFASYGCANLAKGLKQVGLYYKGYIEDTYLIRQQHLAATVSSFGIRRSRSNTNSTEKTWSVEKCDNQNDKENKVSIISDLLDTLNLMW